MKAERIVKTNGRNPAWSPRLYHSHRAAGTEYNVPMELFFEPGTIAEGPGVVVQCLLPEPTMIPADEECHAAVRKYLESPGLRKQFEKLKQMATPAIFEQLPADLQSYVKRIMDKWDGSPTAAIARGEAKLDPLPGKTKSKAANKDVGQVRLPAGDESDQE